MNVLPSSEEYEINTNKNNNYFKEEEILDEENKIDFYRCFDCNYFWINNIIRDENDEIVYDDIYHGSASIILYNKLTLSGMYSLNLNHGDQTFQYDEKGNSPASEQLQKPLIIQPLSFTLMDNAGKEVPYEQIKTLGEVKWVIPNTQTLLSYKGQATKITGDQDQIVSHADLALPASSYDVYSSSKILEESELSLQTFPFSIDVNYDSKKNINYIWLIVKYKDITLDTYTNFSFPLTSQFAILTFG